MTTCTRCNGSKEENVGFDRTHKKDCTLCNGSGELSARDMSISKALKGGDYPIFKVF